MPSIFKHAKIHFKRWHMCDVPFRWPPQPLWSAEPLLIATRRLSWLAMRCLSPVLTLWPWAVLSAPHHQATKLPVAAAGQSVAVAAVALSGRKRIRRTADHWLRAKECLDCFRIRSWNKFPNMYWFDICHHNDQPARWFRTGLLEGGSGASTSRVGSTTKFDTSSAWLTCGTYGAGSEIKFIWAVCLETIDISSKINAETTIKSQTCVQRVPVDWRKERMCLDAIHAEAHRLVTQQLLNECFCGFRQHNIVRKLQSGLCDNVNKWS